MPIRPQSVASGAFRAQARPTLRTSICQRVPRARFQSDGPKAAGTGGSHVVTGVASGAVVALVSYGLYSFTPSGRLQSKVNKATYDAHKAYTDATTKLQQSKPDTNQAIDYLRDMAYSYAAFIPGGRGYVDVAFKDLDTLREGHGEEVDKIVRETYGELQDISKGGLSMDTVNKLLESLRKMSTKLGSVAADGMSDLMDNHPQLKEKLGPGADQLKQLGDRLGPEAKKQVDETWGQAKDIMKSGVSITSVNKIRKLFQEKSEEIKKLGDKAWSEGMEQAKPMLEKNPKIKQLVEENADALKQGNAAELFKKVKDSVQSGNLDYLQEYVTDAAQKAKKQAGGSFGGLEQYMDMVPGGSEILPKLTALGNLAKEESDEAKHLLKDTVEQLKEVLAKQSKKAEELVEKSQK